LDFILVILFENLMKAKKSQVEIVKRSTWLRFKK